MYVTPFGLPWARPCLLLVSTTSPGCRMFLWSAGIVNPILAPELLSFYPTILTWESYKSGVS